MIIFKMILLKNIINFLENYMKKVILIFSMLLFISNINYINSLKSANVFFKSDKNKFEQGDYKEAIKNFNQVIVLNPNYAYACYNRGLTNYKLGKIILSKKYYKKACELYPEFKHTHYE